MTDIPRGTHFSAQRATPEPMVGISPEQIRMNAEAIGRRIIDGILPSATVKEGTFPLTETVARLHVLHPPTEEENRAIAALLTRATNKPIVATDVLSPDALLVGPEAEAIFRAQLLLLSETVAASSSTKTGPAHHIPGTGKIVASLTLAATALLAYSLPLSEAAPHSAATVSMPIPPLPAISTFTIAASEADQPDFDAEIKQYIDNDDTFKKNPSLQKLAIQYLDNENWKPLASVLGTIAFKTTLAQKNESAGIEGWNLAAAVVNGKQLERTQVGKQTKAALTYLASQHQPQRMSVSPQIRMAVQFRHH